MMYRLTLADVPSAETYLLQHGFSRPHARGVWSRCTRRGHWRAVTYTTCCGEQVAWWRV